MTLNAHAKYRQAMSCYPFALSLSALYNMSIAFSHSKQQAQGNWDLDIRDRQVGELVELAAGEPCSFDLQILNDVP